MVLFCFNFALQRLFLLFFFFLIQLDCGIHPADSSMSGLPYFDQMDCDPSEIDLLLISQYEI